MLLQSINNLYIYNHRSKCIFPLHPAIARFALEARKENEIDLKKIEQELAKDYSKKEINLLYHQYLFFKELSFFEADIHRIYGIAGTEWARESFNSVRHIVFEVTEGCNLQCTYCAYGDFYLNRGERKGNVMDFALAKKLLLHFIPIWKAEATKNTTMQISIGFYGGEPLLNFELIAQIVDFCESLGFKKDFFRFGMTTNGLLLKKYQDFLIDKNIHISVSLDGNKENNSYRILKTGENSFDEIINNINSIKEKNKEYFEKNIDFIAVIHDKNSMEQVINFIKEKFGKLPSLSPLSTDDIAPQKKEEFDKMYKEIMSDISSDFVLNLSDNEVGKYDLLSYLRKNCQHLFEYFTSIYNAGKKMPILPTGTCVPFTRRLFLSAEGKILSCERISINHAFGKVEESNEIALDFKTIVDYFNNTISQYKDECLNCYNKNSCGLCAFRCSEDKCEEFMTEKDFIERMAYYLSLVEQYPHLYNYTKNLVTG